jgi:hypothetical protein
LKFPIIIPSANDVLLFIGFGLDMVTNMDCVFCKNKTSGAHSCILCLKPCHAFPPCASSTGDGEEEGFGAVVT